MTSPTDIPRVPREPRREKLPQTRASTTKRVEHGNYELYITVGFYDNGQPGEVFIKVGKAGSFVQGACDMLVMHVSYLLQLGVPMDWVLTRWRGHNLEPMAYKQDPSTGEDRAVSLYDTIAFAISAICSDRGSITHLPCWIDDPTES